MQRTARRVKLSNDEWLALKWQARRVGLQPSTLLRESGAWVSEILARHPNPVDLASVLAEACGAKE